MGTQPRTRVEFRRLVVVHGVACLPRVPPAGADLVEDAQESAHVRLGDRVVGGPRTAGRLRVRHVRSLLHEQLGIDLSHRLGIHRRSSDLSHRPTAVGARTHSLPRRVVVRHTPRAGHSRGGVPGVASGGPTTGERHQPGRRTTAAVFPSRPRTTAGGVDRGFGACSLGCGAGSFDPHPGARWVRLLLPLHDPLGVDGVVAGGDERCRDRVGRYVCRRGRGADRWRPRHRVADVEGGRRAGS